MTIDQIFHLLHHKINFNHSLEKTQNINMKEVITSRKLSKVQCSHTMQEKMII